MVYFSKPNILISATYWLESLQGKQIPLQSCNNICFACNHTNPKAIEPDGKLANFANKILIILVKCLTLAGIVNGDLAKEQINKLLEQKNILGAPSLL